MKLKSICEILQTKIIGHKGAMVECMNDEEAFSIKKGNYYKILDIDTIFSHIYISTDRDSMSTAYKPGRFRLVLN